MSLHPGPLLPGVVVSVRVLSIDQIELILIIYLFEAIQTND